MGVKIAHTKTRKKDLYNLILYSLCMYLYLYLYIHSSGSIVTEERPVVPLGKGLGIKGYGRGKFALLYL